LPKLATLNDGFPLYEILRKVPPDTVNGDVPIYAAARNPEIDVARIVHFAMGIFGTYHQATAPLQQQIASLNNLTADQQAEIKRLHEQMQANLNASLQAKSAAHQEGLQYGLGIGVGTTLVLFALIFRNQATDEELHRHQETTGLWCIGVEPRRWSVLMQPKLLLIHSLYALLVSGIAQNTSPQANAAPAASVAPAGSPSSPILEDGTPVKLRIGRTVSSADAHVGETVDFEVLEVRLSNLLIIPKRGVAWVTVTEAQSKRRWLGAVNWT